MKITSDVYALNFTNQRNKIHYANKNHKNCASFNNAAVNNLNALSDINKVLISNINKSKSIRNITAVSFTGKDKNVKQMINRCAENRGIGVNSCYSLGGEGAVTEEMPEAFCKHYGMDARNCSPYYCFDNVINIDDVASTPKGGVNIVRKLPDGKIEFECVKPDYDLKEGEEFCVHGPINTKDVAKTNYTIVKKTGIEGDVQGISKDLKGMSTYHYTLFEAKTNKDTISYLIHIPEIAKWETAYNTTQIDKKVQKLREGLKSASSEQKPVYLGGFTEDYFYHICQKAGLDALPKMAENQDFSKEGYGKGFNPASHFFHDRQAFVGLPSLCDLSAQHFANDYYTGMNMVNVFHNSAPDYQGAYDALSFFKIMGNEKQLHNLIMTNEEGYKFILEMNDKVTAANEKGIWQVDRVLTKEELEKIDEILKPYIGQYMDDGGNYNLTEIAIEMKHNKTNSKNIKNRFVSYNYSQEVKDTINTPDIAGNIADDLKNVKVGGITNGTTPANMGFDKGGKIGKGILNTDKQIESLKTFLKEKGQTEYIPIEEGLIERLKYLKDLKDAAKNTTEPLQLKNIEKEINEIVEKLFNFKQNSKQWCIDSIADATENGFLESLFFDKDLKERGCSVLGGFSKYKKGDILTMGWGRQEPQKGFPITCESIKAFFMNDFIPEESRLHMKFLLGSGVGPWDVKQQDWKDITEFFNWIKSYKNGKYAKNVVYVNGFLPNKLSICSDFGIFTSRYEPCGLTYKEEACAGAPSASIKTGGAPDIIKKYNGENSKEATGFLTKNPFSMAIDRLYKISEKDAQDLIERKVQEIAQDLKKANPNIEEAEIKKIAIDKLRISQLKDQVLKLYSDMISVFNSKNNQEYKNMMYNCFTKKMDWHNNGEENIRNGRKSACEAYLEALGLAFNKEDYELTDCFFRRNKKPLESMTTTAPIEVVKIYESNSVSINPDVIQQGSKKGGFIKNISKEGKIGALVAIGLAAVFGLVTYCDYKEGKAAKESIIA